MKDPVIEVEQAPQALEGRVVVMPQAYLPKGKSSGKKSSSKGLFIGLVVVLILAIVGVFAVIFLQSSSDQPETQTDDSAIVVAPSTDEEPAEEDLEEEEDIVEEPEEPVEIIEEEVPLINLPAVGVVLPTGADTDQDGLTDKEELIFITSAAVPDTDGDGFLDGAEIGNLYDPATPGALLEVSPQIKIVRNTDRGYQLLAPLAWSASKQSPTGDSFLITPETGIESFTIQMYENKDRMTPVQWYQNNNDTADLNQFNNFVNEAGWSGVQSKDSTLVIATFGDSEPGARAFIFVLHYDPGTSTTLEYPSIWKMMLQSLAILEESPNQPVE